MAKIGIMGGTFNPVHFGHLKMAKSALEQHSLDKVLFIPSGISYMKQDVLDAKHRFYMVQSAIKEEPLFEISDIEVKRDGNSYTCDTLSSLHALYPDDSFYLIMGADSIFQIECWKNPEQIFSLATILVTVRDDYGLYDVQRKIQELEVKFNGRIHVFTMDPVDISSTVIRNKVKRYEPIDGMVPNVVKRYISDFHLYKE